MHTFKPSLVFLSLLSVSVLLLQNSVTSEPLSTFCSTSNNFTSELDDPFAQNLHRVLNRLATISHRSAGFATYSSDGQPSVDKVNGLALCRGDVNETTCRTCVRNAGAEIWQLCPLNKQGIVYYDECLLRYSDNQFFGKIDNDDTFMWYNVENVSSILPPEQFDLQVKQLMNSLKEKAVGSLLMYAAGKVQIGNTAETLYGMAQCTRDLSAGGCGKCLESAIANDLPFCCGGMRGGRVVGGSCQVRYEMYPFLN